MKRFLIALFLSLSFSLFAEPFLGISGASLGKNYDEVITTMQQDNWIIKSASFKDYEYVKEIELNKIDDDKSYNAKLMFSDENLLIETNYEIIYLINNSNSYLIKQKSDLYLDSLISKYNCKKIPDGYYITENNIAIHTTSFDVSFKNELIGYGISINYYQN